MRKTLKLESIPLDYQKAALPGFSNGYGTPAGSGSAQGDNHPYWQIEYDPDAVERCWWYFTLPRNFLRNQPIKVKLHWKAAVEVVGNVVWAACVLGREEGEDLDIAMGDEVEVVDAVQDVADELTVTEITITPDVHLLAPKDAVVLRVARNADDVLDTLTEDADLVWVDFEMAVNPRINR